MDVTTLKIRGDDAIRLLDEHRARYRSTGLYPFMIGDAEELSRVEESGGFNKQDPATILRASFDVMTEDWSANRRKEMQDDLTLWTLNFGLWTFDFGPWNLDFASSPRAPAPGRV